MIYAMWDVHFICMKAIYVTPPNTSRESPSPSYSDAVPPSKLDFRLKVENVIDDLKLTMSIESTTWSSATPTESLAPHLCRRSSGHLGALRQPRSRKVLGYW